MQVTAPTLSSRSRRQAGQQKPRAQGLATQVTATTLTSRSRQRVGQTKPRAQGLATFVTAPTGRVSQAWHVYASTRTLSVSGCTREQETRLEDTQRSRAEVGCGTATTEGYRPVCFDFCWFVTRVGQTKHRAQGLAMQVTAPFGRIGHDSELGRQSLGRKASRRQ